MNPPRASLAAPDLWRSLLALALAVLVAGSLVVLRPFESAIQAARERGRIASARADVEESALAERTRIAATAVRIRSDLRGVALRADAGAQTTGLLVDVQALAARNAVRVISIRPEMTAPAISPGGAAIGAASPQAAASRALGERTDIFELRVRGRFADVVATIRALSLMPTPARVLDARLERHDALSSHERALDATIRVAAIRFVPDRTPAP